MTRSEAISKINEAYDLLETKSEQQREQTEFFTQQFLDQIEYSQFLSKQLGDLHLFVMNGAYYQAGGSMVLHFNPDTVYDIIYRKYKKS